MKEVVLKTNNLTKQYNKNVVLDNVNITVEKDLQGRDRFLFIENK